jgi:sugar phosphate isomerase/epimerase
MKRRHFIQTSSFASLALVTIGGCTDKKETYQNGKSCWPICLNSSTIRPSSLEDKIRIAKETGYDGIELWIGELEKHEAGGGDLRDLASQIEDDGLFVPNVIGLWGCMPMEEQAWLESLEKTRERMRMATAVGSKYVAAIPAPDREDFDLTMGIKRYKELLMIGREEYGITVAFEFVGFLKGIHRLGQAAAIALDTDDSDACLIMDTFHLYCGGSGFNGVKHLNGNFIANFHWNDVPDSPSPGMLRDEHRIYPGDGILPLVQLLKDLKTIGYRGPITLEMFNRNHWKQDPTEVAQIGLQKTLDLIAQVES